MKEKLKELLDQISQEQFEQEWSEIESLNLQGPSLEEILNKHGFIKGNDFNKFKEIARNTKYEKE